VFPLRARKGGVLVRAGQTEASVDMARLAGLVPAGVICEIMKDDGTMARVPDLIEFATEHGLKILTVAELIRYRLQNERYVRRVGESALPTVHGEFRMIAYESEIDGESHIALVMGDVDNSAGPALVRMHTHCLAGDVFSTTLCDCRNVVDASLRAIAREGRGALLYLHNATKGFGIDMKADLKADAKATGAGANVPPIVFHRELRAREHSDERMQRTLRQIGIGGQILADLGIRQIRLLSNNPVHVPALQGFGLEIVEHVPLAAVTAQSR
jgi:3,4-dihydroxy 2-butanone 4-phosphate synthase/GTP cyclohydrolase II